MIESLSTLRRKLNYHRHQRKGKDRARLQKAIQLIMAVEDNEKGGDNDK